MYESERIWECETRMYGGLCGGMCGGMCARMCGRRGDPRFDLRPACLYASFKIGGFFGNAAAKRLSDSWDFGGLVGHAGDGGLVGPPLAK